MTRVFLLAAFLAPVAFAQESVPPQSRQAVIEKMTPKVVELPFCIYEDKKYSEGAIKTADGRTMICMERSTFSANQPREFYWEYGDSPRGSTHLKPLSAAKR